MLRMSFNEVQIFSMELANVNASLAPLLKYACISVRKEMGNPIDEAEYSKIISQAAEGIQEVLKNYFDELK